MTKNFGLMHCSIDWLQLTSPLTNQGARHWQPWRSARSTFQHMRVVRMRLKGQELAGSGGSEMIIGVQPIQQYMLLSRPGTEVTSSSSIQTINVLSHCLNELENALLSLKHQEETDQAENLSDTWVSREWRKMSVWFSYVFWILLPCTLHRRFILSGARCRPMFFLYR